MSKRDEKTISITMLCAQHPLILRDEFLFFAGCGGGIFVILECGNAWNVREIVDYGRRHNFDAFIDPCELVKTITCD